MFEELKSLPELEPTQNIYGLPIPEDTEVQGLIYESPSHSGPSRGAIDIAVDLDTPILAPLDGIVTFVLDTNDQHGPTAEFAKYNNLIGIKHDNGEYSRLSHVAQNSSLVKVGDEVKAGQQVGRVGLVGATTRPHLHWMVSKHIEAEPGYQSLKIQHQRPLEELVMVK